MTETQAVKCPHYCGRLFLGNDEVSAWNAARKEMALFDLDGMRKALASCSLAVTNERPRLLFGASDVATIRQRAGENARERIRRECNALIAEPPEHVDGRICSYLARPARIVAGGFLVLQDQSYAEWARRRLEALLDLPSWMAATHRSFIKRCDHVMANVGADLVCAHDWLGDAADEACTGRLADGLRSHLLLPYLEGARRRDEHWSLDTYLANWKIMTCGESGLTVCAFADRWPEAREALTLSAEGVLEILDAIPREGDWPEGVGYWYATLFMGLRFGMALKRLTAGAVDLLAHPRLEVTGDFGAAHLSPAGRIYNYGDNAATLTPHCAEALLMLGMEKDRGDWRAAARHFPSYSPLWLHLDNPQAGNAPTTDGVRLFPATGVAILRQGRTFVGMRSGSSEVGHAHLDSNSFMLETRDAQALIDEGLWPYAYFLGFFNRVQGYGGNRWNFDALASVGHNVILVDGRGQAYGAAHAGRLGEAVKGDGWMRLTGDGSACYPGLLTKWQRSLLLVGEEWLIIRDVIECEGERHVDWLLHPGSDKPVDDVNCRQFPVKPEPREKICVRDDGNDTILEFGNTGIRIIPLLPDRSMGWRISDVTRRSVYENSNTGETERPVIHYRSFAPLRAAEAFEFLFLIRLDEPGKASYEFTAENASWHLGLHEPRLSIVPKEDTVQVT